MWLARAQSSRTGNCGAISTAGNFRRSPITTAVPISGFSLREFSIGCGAINLPPEVLIKSFLRSVMEQIPVFIELSDVAGRNHPSGNLPRASLSGVCNSPS